ncbi:MAG: hypothetical protein UY75_C0029G0003 [Parcubacteria group bacterium GW2011_GWC2_52_8c]|nr:MAG: hypothetical protein UY75_C0029G0003 [Parcubacteria group bacterium GW2011_GWC2_52_8c]
MNLVVSIQTLSGAYAILTLPVKDMISVRAGLLVVVG